MIEDQFQKMVHDFHIGIGGQGPDIELRVNLIEEEANEFIDAVEDEDVIEAIDALCDLLYVTYGTADVFGVSLDGSADAELPTASVEIVNWNKLGDELRAFAVSIEEAVKSIRVFQRFEARGKLRDRLYEVVRGCWTCASQALGVDLRPFFREVHRTNMHKLTGPKREDGKQLKPEGWKPPRIVAMYNRLQVGKPSTCEGSSPCNDTWIDHFEGGQYCARCEGLNVKVSQ